MEEMMYVEFLSVFSGKIIPPVSEYFKLQFPDLAEWDMRQLGVPAEWGAGCEEESDTLLLCGMGKSGTLQACIIEGETGS